MPRVDRGLWGNLRVFQGTADGDAVFGGPFRVFPDMLNTLIMIKGRAA
jgi:hypothetical protein